jgi:hypothetical protein
MIYDIEIDYQTGDSFHTEEITGESLGIVTSDLDKAKENLKRIKERYIKNRGGEYDESLLTLLTDGENRVIHPFWEGYFETLRGARITAEDSDTSFETDLL